MISDNIVSRNLTIVSSNLSITCALVNKKMGDTSIVVFKFLNDLIQKLGSLFWKEKEIIVIPKNERHGYLENIVSNALNQVKNNEVKEEEKPVKIDKITTYASEIVMVAAPFCLALEAQQFSGNIPFFQKQATLQAMNESLKPSIEAFFGRAVDLEQLKAHGMILKGDQMDHAIYQMGILSIGTFFNAITAGQLPHLHFIFTSLSGLTPIENAVMSLKVPQMISQNAHELNTKALGLKVKARKASINFIKPYVIRFMEPQLMAAAKFVNNVMQEKIQSRELKLPDFGYWGNKFLHNRHAKMACKVVIQQHLTQPATDRVAQGLDLIAAEISEKILDTALTPIHRIRDTALTAFQVRMFDKTMKTTYLRHPLFAGATVIMAGGMYQSRGEIVGRVAGAAMLVMTGQTRWPIIFVYGPRIVNYLIDVKKAFDVVKAEEDFTESFQEMPAPSIKIEEVDSEDEVLGLDPLGLGGMNHESVVETPIAFEADPMKRKGLGGFTGIDEDEIIIDDNQPSLLDNIFTSFIRENEEIINSDPLGFMNHFEPTESTVNEEWEPENELPFDNFIFR